MKHGRLFCIRCLWQLLNKWLWGWWWWWWWLRAESSRRLHRSLAPTVVPFFLTFQISNIRLSADIPVAVCWLQTISTDSRRPGIHRRQPVFWIHGHSHCLGVMISLQWLIRYRAWDNSLPNVQPLMHPLVFRYETISKIDSLTYFVMVWLRSEPRIVGYYADGVDSRLRLF